jgi:uncharacterized protein (TIGR00661 family)
MKILYGIQATGNGHINRSREVVSALKRADHELSVIFSGRDQEQLWGVNAFEPYSVYKGLTFGVSRGKVKYLKTLMGLDPIKFLRDIAGCDVDSFDLVITDFEPISAWAAKLRNIPSIGLGRQYAFRYAIPRAKRDPIAEMVLNYFAPAPHPIGLHYYHFDQPILPPIISTFINKSATNTPHKIVVYLPFEERDDTLQLIQPFSDTQFYVYTSVDKPVDKNNISLRPFSREGFTNDLITCSGVICNAGFTLTSEALHLGKKLLVRPLAGQLEQSSNALALTQLDLGMVMPVLEREIVEEWLKRPSPEPINYPNVAQEVAEWIGEGMWFNIDELVNRVWSKVGTRVFEPGMS